MKKIVEFFSHLFKNIGDKTSGKAVASVLKKTVEKIKTMDKKKLTAICIAVVCILAVGVYACTVTISRKASNDKSTISEKTLPTDVAEENPAPGEPLPSQPQAEEVGTAVPVPVETPQQEMPQKQEVPEETTPQEVPVIQEKSANSTYTCLLTVPDKGGLRTDMIMLMVFRHRDKQIDLISIPRDTKAVYGSKTAKINAIAIKKKSVDMDILKSEVTELTGIPIDSYMFVDIECVKKTVDMFGGVTYNVPRNMKYQDPYQNLYINLQAGEQLIDGNKAEQLLRFRRYSQGDLKRTEVQRQFMIEAFAQHAKAENLWRVPEWFAMADGHIKTDMTVDGFTSLAKTVVDGSYKVNSHLMPCSLSNSYVVCNQTQMKQLAKSLGF